MRLGSNTSDEFFAILAQRSDKINKLFQAKINELVKPIQVKVMLGDTTITSQSTFDPQVVHNFYNKTINSISNWKTDGITSTTDEDLRRVFVKLECQLGNYVLLWHMSLQYHALLYYKPDIKVQKIQKELAEILDNTVNKEKELAEMTDSMIRDRLAEIGYKDLDEQKLFEVLFNNDGIREEITDDMNAKMDFDFKAKDQRKKELFKELDDLLVETYSTTSVLIDENRLVTGEEGCLCTLDLDFLKKNSKMAIFDPKRINSQTKQEITKTLDEIIHVLSD